MESMREAWTDARLDDLNERVADMGRRMDDGFNRLHEDIRSLRSDMDSRFDCSRGDVDSKFDSIRAEMDLKFAALHRLILQVGGGIIVTTLASFLGFAAALS